MLAFKKPSEDLDDRFDFWRMIIDSKTTKIVNLTEFKDTYFPTAERPELKFYSKTKGEISITLDNEENMYGNDNILKRQFTITHSYKSD